jgi:hypothetical protein
VQQGLYYPYRFSLKPVIKIGCYQQGYFLCATGMSTWIWYFFFKALKSNDPNIVVRSSGRVTRHNSTKNILTNVPRVNTLTFQNSYFNRAPRTYNCLPSYIRDADVTIGQFKFQFC